jgi:integrase
MWRATMPQELPLRKYIKVWIKRRKNNAKQDGNHTISYTLEWVEYGKRNFMSLGVGATATYARQAAAIKEKELNSLSQFEKLDPIPWKEFEKKYLETFYPGHDLPPRKRKAASTKWGKSIKSMYAERTALKEFRRIASPEWVHETASQHREKFVSQRITELPSPESVDSELRSLRLILNQAIEWNHLSSGDNPFVGKQKATVGTRRKRNKQLTQIQKPKHFSRQQIVAILDQADKECKSDSVDWAKERLRALIFFVAYTGVRVGEAEYLEWNDLDLENGIADISFKMEHGLKTESSENLIGLPDALIGVLRKWQCKKTCRWVFPNQSKNPWTAGQAGTKPLDQFKDLAERAGVKPANWKMFRHSLSTHGKQWFGLSKEQMRMQLRHASQETQKHYDQIDRDNLRAAVRGLDYRAAKD